MLKVQIQNRLFKARLYFSSYKNAIRLILKQLYYAQKREVYAHDMGKFIDLKRQVIVIQCSRWAHEWHWSVRAIKRANRGMVCISSRSSDQDPWCLTAARKRVTTREAGDVLQVALHHFAARSVLLHTPKKSDVRSDEYGSDNIRFIPTLAQGCSGRNGKYDQTQTNVTKSNMYLR